MIFFFASVFSIALSFWHRLGETLVFNGREEKKTNAVTYMTFQRTHITTTDLLIFFFSFFSLPLTLIKIVGKVYISRPYLLMKSKIDEMRRIETNPRTGQIEICSSQKRGREREKEWEQKKKSQTANNKAFRNWSIMKMQNIKTCNWPKLIPISIWHSSLFTHAHPLFMLIQNSLQFRNPSQKWIHKRAMNTSHKSKRAH